MAKGGGGAWKVAYADFVTAMMAFFMVMWISAQNASVKESVSQYFENPYGEATEARASSIHGIPGASKMENYKAQQAGPHSTQKDGVGGVVGAKDGEKTRSKPQQRMKIFERPNDTNARGTLVLFAEQSAEPTPDGLAQLAGLLPDLLGKPNKIEVRGHASKEPLAADSPFRDKWHLCYARCAAVEKFLVENGIDQSRIRLSQDGSSEPYVRDPRTPYDKSLNSRVEVFALGEYVANFKDSIEERVGHFVDEEPIPAQPAPPATSNAGDLRH